MTLSSKKREKSLLLSKNREYYPAFLAVTGRRCVIVGGGKIAERKALSLMRAGAEVTIISPEITTGLEGYRKKGLINHIRRHYRKGDLKSAFLAIAATDSEQTNRKIVADAEIYHVLLNVVDNPSLCNFIVPSVVIRDPLTIAVSTGGISPAMARTVRREIEAAYGTDFSKYLGFLREIRQRAIKEIRNSRKRKRFLKEIASEKMVSSLRQEGYLQTKKAVRRRYDEERN